MIHHIIPPPVAVLLAAAVLWALNRFVPGLSLEVPGQRLVAGLVAALALAILL